MITKAELIEKLKGYVLNKPEDYDSYAWGMYDAYVEVLRIVEHYLEPTLSEVKEHCTPCHSEDCPINALLREL